MALSPMMKQYMQIKDENPDCILFFRLGDFYEMFFEDAKLASKELELALTGRNCGEKERAPMCGVPFHSADSYIAKLVGRGYKVAICEQVEDPATAKGIVKRQVVQIITPGTVTATESLDETENNYIAAMVIEKTQAGLAYCDITTGEVIVKKISLLDGQDDLVNDMVRMSPKEIIYNENTEDVLELKSFELYLDVFLNCLSARHFSLDAARAAIEHQYGVKGLMPLGLEDDIEIKALGGLFLYLRSNKKGELENLSLPQHVLAEGTMALDKSTLSNLEIVETLFDKHVKGSLLGVLDKTHTAMGGRKLKKWLKEPLNELGPIKDRLDAVECLLDQALVRNNIKEGLKGIYDFERLAGRIAFGNANARDLTALKTSLMALPDLKYDLMSIGDFLAGSPAKSSDQAESSSQAEGTGLPRLIQEIIDKIDVLDDISSLINKSINEDAPLTIREGGLIIPGYSTELDEIKASIKKSQEWISSLEEVERKKTGIKNLKVGYNKVFGYYLEITKSNYDLIPEDYIRKQTLVNAERFITPKLKEVEAIVLNAEARINLLEYKLFNEIKDIVKEAIPRIQKTSQAVSSLDVLTSFAHVSERLGYVKPEMDEGMEILIEQGRHPVIEQEMRGDLFVPNDAYINMEDYSFLLITGPNMAGKSTYMRQVALIVLMAQAGCFVPCKKAKIGLVDRIFTRIGASDNLAAGQSTFFVEMSELAYILNNATDRSLILLDEIGRGTSTYDGLSIAWAVCEHLTNPDHRVRTMFASHYHELAILEDELEGFRNLNVEVFEDAGEVVFLHKIVEGRASRSYGIHVAKIAGVDDSLLVRAEEKLAELESSDDKQRDQAQPVQISMFETFGEINKKEE